MGNVQAAQSAGGSPTTTVPTVLSPQAPQQTPTTEIKKPLIVLEDGPGTFEDLHKKCKG